MRLGSSDSRLSIDVNSLIYDGRFLWHLSISISTLFKILEWATSSYVGSVLKKICQKFAMVDEGLINCISDHVRISQVRFTGIQLMQFVWLIVSK